MTHNTASLRSSRWLTNRAVHDEHGRRIGRLRDVVVHLPRGIIAFAVIERRSRGDRSRRLVAVPWTHLHVDEARCVITIADGIRVLSAAPTISDSATPDFAQPNRHAQWYALLRIQQAPAAPSQRVNCFELD